MDLERSKIEKFSARGETPLHPPSDHFLVILIWKTIFTPVGSIGGSSEMPLMIKFDLKRSLNSVKVIFFDFPYFTTSGQLLNLLLFMLSIMEMYMMRTYAKHTTGYKMVLS